MQIKKTSLLAGFLGILLILTLANTYNIFKLNSRVESAFGTAYKPAADNRLQENKGTPPFQNSPDQQKQPLVNQPKELQKEQAGIDDDFIKGNKSAPITLIEFSDFQCSFCMRFWKDTLPNIEEDYIKTGKVKFVYGDFPLSFHNYAQKAAEAAECAGEQGKFWQYHDQLFEKQAEWSNNGAAEFKKYAQTIDLNVTQFNSCLDSGKYAAKVQKDFSDGQGYGVSGTPTFFINEIQLVGARPYSEFQKVIEQELGKITANSTRGDTIVSAQ